MWDCVLAKLVRKTSLKEQITIFIAEHLLTSIFIYAYIYISDFILTFKVKPQFVIDTAYKRTESYNDISLIRKRLGVA